MSDKHNTHDDRTEPGLSPALWDTYSTDAEDAPMLAASEVRRLGDRRRTRRRVGIASAALGLTLLAGSALALNTDLLSSGDPTIAGSPAPSGSSMPQSSAPSTTSTTPSGSTSTTPSSPTSSTSSSSPGTTTSSGPSTSSTGRPGTLTSANLPTGAEIYLVEKNDLATEDSTSFGYPGESTAHGMCEPELGMSKIKTAAQASREFSGPSSAVTNPADQGEYTVKTFVMEFGSAAEAQQVTTMIRKWYDTCGPSLTASGGNITSEPVLTQNGTTTYFWTGKPASDPESETQAFQNTVVAISGTRVLVMLEQFTGQDNNGTGPYNAQLPGQEAGPSHFVKEYGAVVARLKA